MNYPPPQPQPPLKPVNKGKGCLVALAIVMAVLLVIGVVVGVFVYRAATSPDGQKAISLLGEGTKLVMEATTAPGTKELRGLGCSPATVIDAERFVKLARSIDPDASMTEAPEGARLMVFCNVRRASNAPTCDQVASTYRAAVGTAAGPFVAGVQVTGEPKARCSTLYAADGARVRDVDTTTIKIE